ncbi:hypothetical protein HK097_008456 [Rhizophlyctis rosea]|uniref:Phosphoglycerate mutase n=1 Tax=Rhizophlyctis rosea TaxID=64517 RepID=A0AAD5X8Y4_9FUNG|nr:hypothetical protein HK097_008456 [Rhizophlyctis rosea]
MARINTVFIVRHGIRQDFLTPDFTSPTGLPHDPPLANSGHDQAQDLADHLIQIGPNIKYIVSSPFSRCLQTIQPYAQRTGLKVKIETGIAEWFNAWGKEPTEPPPHPHPDLTDIKRLFPGIVDETYQPVYPESTKWESKDEVHARFGEVLERLIPHIESIASSDVGKGSNGITNNEETGDLLIVTHAAGMIAAVRALLGERRKDVNCGVASVAKLTRTDGEGSAVLASWIRELDGDTRHLKDGAQYNWKFWEDRLVDKDEDEPSI